MQLALLLVTLSACALVFMSWDKRQAKVHRRRIPEAVLIAVAVLGGSPGILLGMGLFRHKTRKPLFFIGVPAVLLGQVFLLYLI